MGCAVVHWQNILKVPNVTSPKNGESVEGGVLRALVEFKLGFPISLFYIRVSFVGRLKKRVDEWRQRGALTNHEDCA